MTTTCFDVALQDGIAHLRLNRPEKRNSMIPEFWVELPEIVNTLHDNGEARVILISSTGPHFTAGMDLGVFSSGNLGNGSVEVGRARANLRMQILQMQETFSVLEKARMPVLAAIQGGCIGGFATHETESTTAQSGSQQIVQVQSSGVHAQRSARVAGPDLPGSVVVQLDAVAIRIA